MPELKETIARLYDAFHKADWDQVVLTGGPPCFHLEDDGSFCLRAEQWPGHPTVHPFVPVPNLLDAAEECERLREDKERLDWLDNKDRSAHQDETHWSIWLDTADPDSDPIKTEGSLREAIDAARSLQTHGRGPESTPEAKQKADPRKEKADA